MKSGAGILDVAGGQSELAFQLVNLNDIPCTVIDPRPYSCEVEWKSVPKTVVFCSIM